MPNLLPSSSQSLSILIFLIRLSITKLKRKGERGSPCLIPLLMGIGFDDLLSLENVVQMLVYRSLITLIVLTETPFSARARKMELWETVSKALEISRKDT